MLIPRRTKIERIGIVVSVLSLLAVIIGTIAVAPESVVADPIKPRVIFNQAPGTQYRDCLKEVTAQQAKSPQGVSYSGDRWSGPTPSEVCEMRRSGVAVKLRTLSPTQYTQVYWHDLAAAVESPAGHRVSELLLFWGVRCLIIGLFFMYLFEATIGRLLRFIWRGSLRA